jgi:CheY-like chemotaxis protein
MVVSARGSAARGAHQGTPVAEQKPKLNVLVIEDDKDVRESFVELLAEEGYDVAQVGDGREAESYLRSNPPPAAIILDLMMPRLDGWAVAALMRQGRLPQVPIVVVTAADDQWGYPAPANRVLKKPVDVKELLRAVRAIAQPSG